MPRSFSQFTPAELMFLRAITIALWGRSVADAHRARTSGRRQEWSRADSNAARYERCITWIDRARRES